MQEKSPGFYTWAFSLFHERALIPLKRPILRSKIVVPGRIYVLVSKNNVNYWDDRFNVYFDNLCLQYPTKQKESYLVILCDTCLLLNNSWLFGKVCLFKIGSFHLRIGSHFQYVPHRQSHSNGPYWKYLSQYEEAMICAITTSKHVIVAVMYGTTVSLTGINIAMITKITDWPM